MCQLNFIVNLQTPIMITCKFPDKVTAGIGFVTIIKGFY